ncbi:hypothetical protein BX600DRAFT_514415 [Xylariales sp. PMI_506]|nr:hypothetical protein BX600DRAFT_514415 [Xylariales sp. PMI_506]
MYFPTALSTLLLAGLVIAAPTPATVGKRANVLTFRPYADFQVSDGVAGNALAEVNAKFPLDLNDPTSVSASDLAILSDARSTAEDAETAYVDAIAAATGDEAAALQVGLIKNKVLKLQTFVMELTIQLAQGKRNQKAGTAELASVQALLNTNIANDQKSAGQASQSVAFTADDANAEADADATA